MKEIKNIPVLIIGGGPVGLSMALALARQNIKSLVIERHPGTTQHPRARGVNTRSMELFRQWENIVELLKYEQPKEARRIIWAQSLQGEEITRITMEKFSYSAISPTEASFVSQDRVEESLYHCLLNYKETEVHFLKEIISFEENNDGVITKILNRTNNQEEIIKAQYLIAADGAHSHIRKQLEIEMIGPDNLGKFCSIYCEIDISMCTKDRPAIGYFFTDPKLSGRFLASVDGANRWIVGLRYTEGNVKEDFTDEYCINAIRQITGVENLKVHIINKNFWTMAAQIAKQYRKGRVFLVGDAAHRIPPTGGFGMNTGIQDAHNLAWKLAFVINHNLSEKLLDTYFEERAPVAEQNIKWSMENAARYTEINKAIHSGDMGKLKFELHEQNRNLNFTGLDLGFIYHSTIIISENDQTLSVSPAKYVATTLPGSRAPHVQLIKDHKKISILDLFEKDFVLLIGPNGQAWQKAADDLIHSLSIPLKIFRIANDGDLSDPENIWLAKYEISATGAVLVRPDGHVAWRSRCMVDQPKNVLNKVLSVIVVK